MKAIELITQIKWAIESGYIEEDDELILIGTGDKASDYFRLGFSLPKLYFTKEKYKEIIENENPTGYYGIGVLDKEKYQ